jgi:hypothetical protein
MNILRLIPRNTPRTGQSQADVLARVDEDVRAMIGRGRFMGDRLGFGPNFVHAVIGRGPSGEFGKPGTFEDLGWSKNLKTTVGMDWLHNSMGGGPAAGTMAVSNACTATTYGVATTPFTASALVGMQIVVPITAITTQPVYGNIGANTTSVITIDQWWTQTDGAGTTPAVGNFGMIIPNRGPARFMALTTDTGAPAVGDTTLASENTTNGCARALATFAHTPGATTFTQYKIWTATGALTALHKAGLFTSGTLASAGVLVADTALNADATLANGDTVAVTWTWTLPSAG